MERGDLPWGVRTVSSVTPGKSEAAPQPGLKAVPRRGNLVNVAPSAPPSFLHLLDAPAGKALRPHCHTAARSVRGQGSRQVWGTPGRSGGHTWALGWSASLELEEVPRE